MSLERWAEVYELKKCGKKGGKVHVQVGGYLNGSDLKWLYHNANKGSGEWCIWKERQKVKHRRPCSIKRNLDFIFRIRNSLSVEGRSLESRLFVLGPSGEALQCSSPLSQLSTPSSFRDVITSSSCFKSTWSWIVPA